MPKPKNLTQNESFCLGITGQIGSGKSTVCLILKKFGAIIIDCDQRAKLILQKSSKVRLEIMKLLGKEAYQNKNPDYDYIAKKTFIKNPNQLKHLNKIIHPPLKEWITSEKIKYPNKFIVIESALLFESGFDCLTDAVVFIEAPLNEQINRLQKNRNLSLIEIKSRLDQQNNLNLNKNKSQFQIINDKNISNLELKIKFLWDSQLKNKAI